MYYRRRLSVRCGSVTIGTLLFGVLTFPTGPATAVSLCEGDCSGNGRVTVDELVLGTSIALGDPPLGDCPAFDADEDGGVAIDELVTAVDNAIDGCFDTAIPLPGLQGHVAVSTDALGVPHVVASTLEDAVRVQGYLHARDRFFQMDLRRRSAEGRRAELTGAFTDLAADAALRTAGIVAAAQRQWNLLSAFEQDILEAYAEGVNAWLSTNPLPAEYAQLEVTQVPPWEALESLKQYIAIGLLSHIEYFFTSAGRFVPHELAFTELLEQYEDALGEEAGRALFFEDIARIAPLDPAPTVPEATGQFPFVACTEPPLRTAALRMTGSRTAIRDESSGPFHLSPLLLHQPASNAWGVAGARSAGGSPLVATDGHNFLAMPAENYEMHTIVTGDPTIGDWNISGMTFPGGPGFALAFQTSHIATGVTSNVDGDEYDIFRDRLVRGDPSCKDDQGEQVRLCIDSAGSLHPVEESSETYRLNLIDGVADNSSDATPTIAVLAPQAVHVLHVPFRSFGPILSIDDRGVVDDPESTPAETHVLTLQFTGLEPVPGVVQGIVDQLTARDVFEYEEALRGSVVGDNSIVADTAGNLAYFIFQEVPLRADLEAGRIEGELPAFVRDGSGPANWIPDPDHSQGQSLPYRVIPRDEMPRAVNPSSGFLANTNNDPAGTNLDNDAGNQCRPSNPNAIYYLGRIRDHSRAGRITRLLRDKIDAGEPLSLDDMKRFQGDTVEAEAEVIVPYLLAAWENAGGEGAPAELAAFTEDADIGEAVERLAEWDFSTPTGIPEGYDAADADGVRNPDVSSEEAANSVAATLYNAWRGTVIRNTIFRALQQRGLPRLPDQASFPPFYVIDLHHLLSQEPFTGVGASGIDFFPDSASLEPADRRDVTLLAALRDTLDDLASNRYAAAFGNSTDQDDYRWGRLHRLSIPHPLGGAYNVPPAGGFTDLGPGLAGLSRDGGSSLNFGQFGGILSSGSNAFVFGSTARYRLASSPGDTSAGSDGVLGFASLAGGSSENVNSPLYASQLATHLTVDYHRVPMSQREVRDVAVRVEVFDPPGS